MGNEENMIIYDRVSSYDYENHFKISSEIKELNDKIY